MSSWADPFRQRLQLLTDLLPLIAREPRFALKGGTAINLFEHDLPRLSVDVDLAWLPVGNFEDDRRAISQALENIANSLRKPPLRLHVATRPRRAAFGFAEMQVLHFADLYAGKLAATLSRQHPRDLFDTGLLLDSDRLDAALWRTFLIYLTASPKPAAELLEPRDPRDLATVFRAQFDGMTATRVTVESLLATRRRLLERIPALMDAAAAGFLVSVERESPDFNLIGLPQAANLPAIRRKLQNLAQRTAAKREADYRQLADTLERLAAR